jgi:hypothetical protein
LGTIIVAGGLTLYFTVFKKEDPVDPEEESDNLVEGEDTGEVEELEDAIACYTD